RVGARARGAGAPAAEGARVSDVLERFRRIAKAKPQSLLLAEGGDERVVRAADRIGRAGLADVAVVGTASEVRETARRADLSPGGVRIVDAGETRAIERTAAALAEVRGDRLRPDERARLAADPLFQAAAMVR